MAEMSRRTNSRRHSVCSVMMHLVQLPAGWVQTLPQWCGVSVLKTFPGQRRQ